MDVAVGGGGGVSDDGVDAVAESGAGSTGCGPFGLHLPLAVKCLRFLR